MDLKIGDVVKVRQENDEIFGTVESYTVGSEGKSYTIVTETNTLDNVQPVEIVSKWVEWKARTKK